jgi:hypothetical protein
MIDTHGWLAFVVPLGTYPKLVSTNKLNSSNAILDDPKEQPISPIKHGRLKKHHKRRALIMIPG